jgi:hypothetical protein
MSCLRFRRLKWQKTKIKNGNTDAIINDPKNPTHVTSGPDCINEADKITFTVNYTNIKNIADPMMDPSGGGSLLFTSIKEARLGPVSFMRRYQVADLPI